MRYPLRSAALAGVLVLLAAAAAAPAFAQFSLFGIFGGGKHFTAETVSIDAAAAARAVSDFRKQNGLPPVTVNAAMMAIAATQAKAMAEAGTMSHDVGGSFEGRLRAGHYDDAVAVENIAAGQKTFDAAFLAWQKSPGHRANMLSPTVTQFGIAAYRSAESPNGIYWSLNLAASHR